MSYVFLIVPFVSFLVSQISKFFIKSNKLPFSWKSLMAYSGMPSGHAAVTASLTLLIGLRFGLASPLFAIMMLLAVLIIRDAVGIRSYIGKQGKIINTLVKDLEEDEYLEKDYPKMKEKVGHTIVQIAVGSAIGCLIALMGNYLIE
jgi:acid phosphatase family membrane protein YuiD